MRGIEAAVVGLCAIAACGGRGGSGPVLSTAGSRGTEHSSGLVDRPDWHRG